jgi:very-short-patch-repair endonuclease
MPCHSSSKKLCGRNECLICYNRSFATNPKAEYWSPKNDLDPIDVHKSSNKKYLFDCADCGHELELKLNDINKGVWCAYCNKSGLCNDYDCYFCFQKSFVSHPMSHKWSLQNEMNPRDVCKGSEKKCWFHCSTCNHEFQTVLYSIKKDTHCPYCSNQRLCDGEDCDYCFQKSCASHIMKKNWSDENILSPREVFLQSNKKMKFYCSKCKHDYITTPTSYYNSNNASCIYCAGQKLCDKDDCSYCFQKSFASHHYAQCWSSKNKINPRTVFKGSEKRCTFNCDVCKSEFESILYNVLTGYWCPFCKNKSEAKLFEYIQNNYIYYKSQLRFDWCRYSKTNNIMPIDFGLVDKKLFIELDGIQHFTQVSNWDAPENVQSKDVEKIKYCLQKGYSMIHIFQKDVWNDVYDWKTVLSNIIEEVSKTDTPSLVFISSNNIYKQHILQLGADINYRVIHPSV